MSDSAATRREAAIRRLRFLLPALFALGFLFYAGISVFPLAGMAVTPPDPAGGIRQLILWLAVASAIGGLFALFGALVVSVSGLSDDAGGD